MLLNKFLEKGNMDKAAHNIGYVIRVWANNADYQTFYYAITRSVREVFDAGALK